MSKLKNFNIDFDKFDYLLLYSLFIESLKNRVFQLIINSWYLFCIRFVLHIMSMFVFSSSIFLYMYDQISATNFSYILPLSALSSASLLFISTKFKNENKSDLLMDVGVDLLSEFIPSSNTKRKSCSKTKIC